MAIDANMCSCRSRVTRTLGSAARWPSETSITLEAIDEALGALQTMRERPADSLVTLRDLVANLP
jgi:hypothetical protein